MALREDTDLAERVAKIEQWAVDHNATTSARYEQMAQVNAKLDRLELELARYRGLVGGVLLVVTAVVTFTKFFWGDITRFFGR